MPALFCRLLLLETLLLVFEPLPVLLEVPVLELLPVALLVEFVVFVLLDVPELLVFALELVLVFCAVLLTVLLVVELVSVDGVVPPFTVVAFPFMVDEVDPVIEPVVAPVCEPVLVFDDVPFEVALPLPLLLLWPNELLFPVLLFVLVP